MDYYNIKGTVLLKGQTLVNVFNTQRLYINGYDNLMEYRRTKIMTG